MEVSMPVRYSELKGVEPMGRSVVSDSAEVDPPIVMRCLTGGCAHTIKVRKFCGFIGTRCKAGHVSIFDSLDAMNDEDVLHDDTKET